MSKFTPGPWVIDACEDACGNLTVRRADGTEHGNTEQEPISTVYSPHDASLIAAAPDLLEALREINAEVTEDNAGLTRYEYEQIVLTICDIARTAIAKAEGKKD
jgi:hypothetical protein